MIIISSSSFIEVRFNIVLPLFYFCMHALFPHYWFKYISRPVYSAGLKKATCYVFNNLVCFWVSKKQDLLPLLKMLTFIWPSLKYFLHHTLSCYTLLYSCPFSALPTSSSSTIYNFIFFFLTVQVAIAEKGFSSYLSTLSTEETCHYWRISRETRAGSISVNPLCR